MNIARFFIDRPIFAAVLSIVIFVAGALSIPLLPLSEYPEVVPPQVEVAAVYPGANPTVLSETVAAPLEQAINGVENLLYMKSLASGDGRLSLSLTFKLGTDPDAAQVQVQNRVSQVLSRLPEDVRRQGVTTQKRSSNIVLFVNLLSPDGRYDAIYLRNYAVLHVLEELKRIPGVGDTVSFGGGEYAMRIWLDPGKVAGHDLTASDVVAAIREQNVQISAGQIGAPPTPDPADFQLIINAAGRLVTVEDFQNIVIRTGSNGEVTRLSDVARVELGADSYGLRALLDNQPSVGVGVFQAPGTNALDLSNRVKSKMHELSKSFPEGLAWSVVYDPTAFVAASIEEVVKTLFEAAFLVVLVVLVFLQTWRASIIPLVAVPISIVGTFAVLLGLGFTINTLTLFGLVLAIGIVVDDAIVVVENVERHIDLGQSPKEAAREAMKEVTSPIIAVALVLCAVFVPMTLLGGVSGQFFRQFAATIAISTVISAFNSLTLSPALAAMLLRPRSAAPDRVTRVIDALFGRFFRWFDKTFRRAGDAYTRQVGKVVHRRGPAFLVYAVCLGLAAFLFRTVPAGFIPSQDKMYLIGILTLPPAASIDRTDAFTREVARRILETEGVAHAVEFPGLNAAQFTNTSNAGTIFVILKPLGERKRTAEQIAEEVNEKFFGLKEGLAFAILPPPLLGIGSGDGFSLFVENRAGLGPGELAKAVSNLQGALAEVPGMHQSFTTFEANVPQLQLTIDRTRAKAQGVALTSLYDTLQTYLGSAYVNDFTRFGRTFQVLAQADAPFRLRQDQIGDLKTRNAAGQLVPIGSLLKISQTFGPDPVIRYNGYPAADLFGSSDQSKLSSGDAIEAVARIAAKVLPNGIAFEWTDLTFQQVNDGSANLIVFPLALLLVFLVLAALYESWVMPLAIILIVPLCGLAALLGVQLTGGDRNIFVQVGLVVLMGLATKNAILIVEFASDLEKQGMATVEAAIEACKLRLRPIVMTSIAFVAGVTPMLLSSGPGFEVRRAMGVTVFSGMLGVTFFGLVLTPVFYVALRMLALRFRPEGASRGQEEA